MSYSAIWAIDFEYGGGDGENPIPVCCCAIDLLSGRQLRLWEPELAICPFDTGPSSLFVAYAAQAELGCFLALRWPIPRNVLDLHIEFRLLTNGQVLPVGPDKKARRSLLGALIYYGLPHIAALEKDTMRERILAGPPWSRDDREAILAYCMSDVDSLRLLLPAMEPDIAASPARFAQALARGRYTHAVAAMVRTGVPLDTELLRRLQQHWHAIQAHLIATSDPDYVALYDDGHFREKRFFALVERRGYAWPRLASGRFDLDAKTFKTMGGIYPEIEPLRQLRKTLGEMRLHKLTVGSDRRNRTGLFPFGTLTGRNAPSSSESVFGTAAWVRAMIRPDPGRALAYLDWASQEVAIAAVLSGDARLLESVGSGDPYLSFAIMAGLAPANATKASHGRVRDRVKACVLGIGYGMGAHTLAASLDSSLSEARLLLRLFDERYPVFAAWREESLNRALIGRRLSTAFGWELRPSATTKPTTLKNFPIQSAGAEILRLACCLGVEAGIRICAPIHDAVLIEAATDTIEDAAAAMQAAMAEASAIVLGGLVIRTDVKIIRHPDRFTDPRGEDLFGRVMGWLDQFQPLLVEVEQGYAG